MFQHLSFLTFLTLLIPSSAEPSFSWVTSTDLEDPLKGRILIEELNCVACHQAEESFTHSSRTSPRLQNLTKRINPDYLQRFIASPHEVKPGTMMPDLLAPLDPQQKQQVAKELTHFLLSLDQETPFRQEAIDPVAATEGNQLFHTVGCVACHSPRSSNGLELIPHDSVALGELSTKYSYQSLRQFLQKPHLIRPSGRMPDLRLPNQDLDRIVHYLLQKTEVPGHLRYKTWRGKVWEGLKGDVTPEKGGLAKDFSLSEFRDRNGKVAQHTAIQLEGYIEIERPGEYHAYLEMNGGTLSFNGSKIIDERPSDRRGMKKFTAKTTLQKGWNSIELLYFHTGRNADLKFEIEGPNFKRQPIPSSLLSISKTPIPVVTPLQVDPDLAQKGKAHFGNLGCAKCHDDVKVDSPEYTAFAALQPEQGCLSQTTPKVHYHLNPKDRALITKALHQGHQRELTDLEKVHKTLTTFNCIACHERKGLGGISTSRNSFFTGSAEELGDQGRIPPPLTHVGAKLTESWMREVLIHGNRQREYLNTRMPLFGETHVGHLVDLFAKVDQLEQATLPKVQNIQESKKAGYEMIGADGLSCIACHDYNGQKSGGAGALDIVHVTKRLQKNWFHLYMRQPSRFHPTVIMPTYWPGGQPIRPEILEGDTEKQIEALWNYLSDGQRAKTPKGLSRQSNEIRVADETIMVRGRGTASYRGIGVGYPERISLVFDSREMNLTHLWKGEFVNIGHGRFNIRGENRFAFAPGIPFHRLDSLDESWPYKGKANYTFPQDHGYQYRGYHLDAQKRPTFRYQYGTVFVSDFFEDQVEKDAAYFQRTMTFETSQNEEPFFFRVASGKKISEVEKGWQIDQLHLRISPQPDLIIRDGEPQELLLPLTLKAGKTTLNLEYRW